METEREHIERLAAGFGARCIWNDEGEVELVEAGWEPFGVYCSSYIALETLKNYDPNAPVPAPKKGPIPDRFDMSTVGDDVNPEVRKLLEDYNQIYDTIKAKQARAN